jgi:hypothetical protein
MKSFIVGAVVGAVFAAVASGFLAGRQAVSAVAT